MKDKSTRQPESLLLLSPCGECQEPEHFERGTEPFSPADSMTSVRKIGRSFWQWTCPACVESLREEGIEFVTGPTHDEVFADMLARIRRGERPW